MKEKKKKKKVLKFRAIWLKHYPNAKKFRDGNKPIECDYVSDGIKDSSGYGVLIDGRNVDVFYGQGDNNWKKGKRFKNAKEARKWANKNLNEPLTKTKLRKLGFKKYWSG